MLVIVARIKSRTPIYFIHFSDGLAEIFKVIHRVKWRDLTDIEKCAIGLFHKNPGDDMEILFDPLPSRKQGWRNGLEFARELEAWTLRYEEEVARPTATTINR